jgi:adenylyl cyclase-associated protein
MSVRWVVEHHIGNKGLTIEDCDTKQSVYVYGCKDSVLQVKGTSHQSATNSSMMDILFLRGDDIHEFHRYAGKVNNITIDKCNKMGVLFKV